MSNPWGDTPVVWSYPSIIPGVTETLYCDCPELAPASTYKTKALKDGVVIMIPRRDKVKTPAVLDKDGKVTKAAEYVVEKPEVKDKDGKVVQPAQYKQEIVLVTEYKQLLQAKMAELAVAETEEKPVEA